MGILLPGHTVENMKIQILEVVPHQDKNIRATLLDRELHWLKVLNTSFPYGLNDSIKGYGLVSSGLDPSLSNKHPYFTIPLNRSFRSHGNRKRATRKINSAKVDQLIMSYNSDSIDRRMLYINLRSLKRREITYFKKQIENLVATNSIHSTFHMASQAFIASCCSSKQLPDHNSYFLTCAFPNKGIELIKLGTIFKDRSLNKLYQKSLIL